MPSFNLQNISFHDETNRLFNQIHCHHSHLLTLNVDETVKTDYVISETNYLIIIIIIIIVNRQTVDDNSDTGDPYTALKLSV